MHNITVGSICSGIEAASVAWKDLAFQFSWFSEIADFPSQLLAERYPDVPNLGDMTGIAEKLRKGEAIAPDLICGGTPCQAFSLAGWKRGLADARGNLTLGFADVADTADEVRNSAGLAPCMVLWENVEGVLKDKTNAFGCFVSLLAGLNEEVSLQRWPTAGLIHGPKRNVAWRVLDAKFFGPPQQRRRLYVLAGPKDFFPEHILFEKSRAKCVSASRKPKLSFEKSGRSFELFRSYTDCLYAAYGTKWNGNAAAYNGSLFVVQDGRLRRFTPLECERLMGFPDGYTALAGTKPTSRYQALGNSWSVPVIRWIGQRLVDHAGAKPLLSRSDVSLIGREFLCNDNAVAIDLSGEDVFVSESESLNTSERPNTIVQNDLESLLEVNVDASFYISPAGCFGILRRSKERRLSINAKLRAVLEAISSEWTHEEIETVSRKQRRGRFSVLVSDEQLMLGQSIV